MKADLTRDTFDAATHFSRVVMQQGRVTVDADWNEQISILLHIMRTTAMDVIGPFAGPTSACGFVPTSSGVGDLSFSKGRYYVDGILAEIDVACDYMTQPYYTPPATDPVATELAQKTPTENIYWLYLDVWEWHVTYISDNDMREVALGGPDTCTRTVVVWQIKSLSSNQTQPPPGDENNPNPGQTNPPPVNPESNPKMCQAPLAGLLSTSTGHLTARLDPGQPVDSPCIMPPSAQYRGVENQLYRVEIQAPGPAGTATFKWSRDNGSRVTALLGQTGNVLTVAQSRDFAAGNWVELLDDTFELMGNPGTLVKLSQANNGTLTVDPSSLTGGATVDSIYAGLNQNANPRVIRWDQTDTSSAALTNGAIPITESPLTAQTWTDLEDGVQVSFLQNSGENANPYQYRTGDYWLIPARVATGTIEWPIAVDPKTNVLINVPMPPDGIEHHYAPLGFVTWSGGTFQWDSCQCTFDHTANCPSGGTTETEERINADNPMNFDAKEIIDADIVAALRQASGVPGVK